MKAYIGSHFIYKQPAGHEEKYIAYQILDYVGRNHILVEEEGWAMSNAKFSDQKKRMVIHLDCPSTHKTSIVEIDKFIKDYQNDAVWFYFCRHEIVEKLTHLSNALYRNLNNDEYDEWIKSLMKEICEPVIFLDNSN